MEPLDQLPATEDLLKTIDPNSAMTALWFSSALVEEVSKTDSNSIKRLGSCKWPLESFYSLTDKGLAEQPVIPREDFIERE